MPAKRCQYGSKGPIRQKALQIFYHIYIINFFDFNNYEMFTVFYIEVLRPLASVNVAIPSQNFKFFFHIPSFRARYNGSILRNMSANKYSVCSLFL